MSDGGRSGCFVTGTDTGVGKTLVAAALLHRAGERGLRTAALKPVAAGARLLQGLLVNDDALLLQRMSNSYQLYEEVNPVTLSAATVPHIAARQESQPVSVAGLVHHCRVVLDRDDVNFVVVEGADGWLVPLNDEETLADLAVALQLPVVLVVGMKPGCLNHALLTCQAVRARNLPLAGWVASCIDPQMVALAEHLAALDERIDVPCLGVVDHLEDPTPENVARALQIDRLLG